MRARAHGRAGGVLTQAVQDPGQFVSATIGVTTGPIIALIAPDTAGLRDHELTNFAHGDNFMIGSFRADRARHVRGPGLFRE
ncbi:MAG: hypothetical protein WKF28_03020 [Rubrobacteraceae bacterium]